MNNLCEVTGIRYVHLSPERFSLRKVFASENSNLPRERDEESLQACGTIGIPYEDNEITYSINIMSIENSREATNTIELMEKVILLDQVFPENINIVVYVSDDIYRELTERTRLSLYSNMVRFNFEFSFEYFISDNHLNKSNNYSLRHLLQLGDERQLKFECFSTEWECVYQGTGI